LHAPKDALMDLIQTKGKTTVILGQNEEKKRVVEEA